MRCPRCDADTPEGAKFCIECGSPLNLRCPQCGADTLPRAKLCAECSTPLGGQILARPSSHSQSPLRDTHAHLADKNLHLPQRPRRRTQAGHGAVCRPEGLLGVARRS